MVKFVNIILAETHPNKEAAASIRSQRAIQHKLLKHNPDVKWQTPRVRFPFLSVSSPGVFILFYSLLFFFILLYSFRDAKVLLFFDKSKKKWKIDNGKWKIESFCPRKPTFFAQIG